MDCWEKVFGQPVTALKTLCFKPAGLLGRHNSITSNEIIESNVLSAMLALIRSVKHKSQLAGLAVISGLALSSEAAAKKLLTPEVLQALKASVLLPPHQATALDIVESAAGGEVWLSMPGCCQQQNAHAGSERRGFQGTDRLTLGCTLQSISPSYLNSQQRLLKTLAEKFLAE